MFAMDLPWDDVKYLEAIERTGKVTAAARDLGVSLSTLYRRVAALEAVLGQVCLLRGPGGGSLTETGQALALVGRRTRKSLSEVTGLLRSKENQLEGEVSLTTVAALLPFVEGPVQQLTRQHRGIHVTLHLGDDGPSVRNREVDTALGVMRKPPVGCWGRKVARMPYGVFATREVAALQSRPWLQRAGEPTSAEAAWEAVHAHPFAVRAPFAAMVSLCAHGVGLALIPRRLAARHPRLIELPEYAASVAGLERTVWFLTHPDQRKTPRVVALMAALVEGFAEE